MDFYQVLENRRTIRDFSDKKVTDEVLEKVLSAAFKAPTNDHLRQFEFIVVRGQENIARLISPVAENTKNIQQTGLDAVAQTTTYAYAKQLSRTSIFPAKGFSSVPTCRPKFT